MKITDAFKMLCKATNKMGNRTEYGPFALVIKKVGWLKWSWVITYRKDPQAKSLEAGTAWFQSTAKKIGIQAVTATLNNTWIKPYAHCSTCRDIIYDGEAISFGHDGKIYCRDHWPSQGNA